MRAGAGDFGRNVKRDAVSPILFFLDIMAVLRHSVVPVSFFFLHVITCRYYHFRIFHVRFLIAFLLHVRVVLLMILLQLF